MSVFIIQGVTQFLFWIIKGFFFLLSPCSEKKKDFFCVNELNLLESLNAGIYLTSRANLTVFRNMGVSRMWVAAGCGDTELI